MQADIVFGLLVLIFSVVLHEAAHGYMANWLGDPTARLAGRLTLNPLKHIDPVGSVLIPALLVFFHSPFLIGYAKPVPYNPYNFRGRYDEGLVAFAGPAVNLLLVAVFALIIRFGAATLDPSLLSAFAVVVYLNLLLALFNLMPVPPLDGSKVLSTLLAMLPFGVLSRAYETLRLNFERLGILSGTLLILLVFFFLFPYFSALLQGTFSFLTGVRL